MQPGEQCRTLLDRYGLRIVILTCGAAGSSVFAPDTRSYIPTPRVEVADTVGAGDSFTASFLAALLSGLGIGGSTQAGRGCRGPRLLAARRHAPAAGTVYRSAAQ